MKSKLHELDEERFDDLASALGDSPQTVIEWHQLRRRQCRAFLLGEPGDFSAAIVQSLSLPSEPCGFGGDPDAMYDLLQEVSDWTCICVPSDIAEPLGRVLESQSRLAVSYLDDIYHVTSKEVSIPHHPEVNLIRIDDFPLTGHTPLELLSTGPGKPLGESCKSFAVAAIVSSELVSMAHVSAFSDRYADVAVETHKGRRGQGFGTVAASLLVNLILQRGLIPVWSCGESNVASLRIAERLGFREVSRKRYVITDDK